MTGPSSTTAPSTPARGDRPRPILRRVEVVQTFWLTPRLVSVTVAGDELRGFASPPPTSHLKVFLPSPGESQPSLPEFGAGGPAWADGPGPVMRTYTPRRFDPTAMTLEIQFVIHGAGPASNWAARAARGDQLALAGPGGRFDLDPAVEHWWIGGDESAVPAIGTLLDALAPSTTAEVHLEVAGPEDEIELTTSPAVSVHWYHRLSPAAYGSELSQAAAEAPLGAARHVWVAGEATAVRGIRRLLIERRWPIGALTTRGYWRSGHPDHPDHDYGES